MLFYCSFDRSYICKINTVLDLYYRLILSADQSSNTYDVNVLLHLGIISADNNDLERFIISAHKIIKKVCSDTSESDDHDSNILIVDVLFNSFKSAL